MAKFDNCLHQILQQLSNPHGSQAQSKHWSSLHPQDNHPPTLRRRPRIEQPPSSPKEALAKPIQVRRRKYQKTKEKLIRLWGWFAHSRESHTTPILKFNFHLWSDTTKVGIQRILYIITRLTWSSMGQQNLCCAWLSHPQEGSRRLV